MKLKKILLTLSISVCGIWTQEEVPEIFKPEKIVVLNIENITVHPKFVNGKAGQETLDSV
jgi:hypothetical protein